MDVKITTDSPFLVRSEATHAGSVTSDQPTYVDPTRRQIRLEGSNARLLSC